MSSHQTNSVYLVLYSRFNNPNARFDCYRPIDSLLDIGVDFLTGPFTHCHLAYGARKSQTSGKVGVLCTKITAFLGGVRHDVFEDHRIGDCYLQLNLSDTEYNLLLNTVTKLAAKSSGTYFSYSEFFGWKAAELPSETRKGWTCASLNGYLLQKIGLIDRSVEVNKLNVTLLYLLLRQSNMKCKQVNYYPFLEAKAVPSKTISAATVQPKTKEVKTADQIYLEYMHLRRVEDIPHVVPGRRINDP